MTDIQFVFSAEIVAQFKYTVLIMPSGVNLVTGLDFAPEQYQSEHSITDAELKVGFNDTKFVSSISNARQSAWTANAKQCGLSSCDSNSEMLPNRWKRNERFHCGCCADSGFGQFVVQIIGNL